MHGFRNHTITKGTISQAAAGRKTLGTGATGKKIYLARLRGTFDTAAATFQLVYDDDGAGTNEVELSGAQGLGVLSGPHAIVENEPDFALTAPAGKYLVLVTTGGKFKGHFAVATEL